MDSPRTIDLRIAKTIKPSGVIMPSNTLDVKAIAYSAVGNVLSGLTADGAAQFPRAVPFPRSPVMVGLSFEFLAQILAGLEPLESDELTLLTAKFLAYVGKSGMTSREFLRWSSADAIIRALQADRSLIRSRAGIATILKHYHKRCANSLSALAAAPITPRRTLWAAPPFSLREATHPHHLRVDGLTLHHCTARLTDWDLLSGLERPPAPREALFALKYWREIEAGVIRILTLMENDTPLVTIEYAIVSRRISHMQALRPISVDDDFFPHLCRALHHFCKTTPVSRINYLPKPFGEDTILTTDGRFVSPSEQTLRNALPSTFRVSPASNRRLFDWATTLPHITLDLTRAPEGFRRRLRETNGSVAFDNDEVSVPHLRSVGGDFICTRANRVSCPELRTIGVSNRCISAESVYQPRLFSIGAHNKCGRARAINQASLRFVGGDNECGAALTLIQHCLNSQ